MRVAEARKDTVATLDLKVWQVATLGDCSVIRNVAEETAELRIQT